MRLTAFCQGLPTGDKTWTHHFVLETKRESVTWHQQISPQKFKITPLAIRIIDTVLWGMEGVIAADIKAISPKPLTQTCTFELFKSCKIIKGEFSPLTMLLKLTKAVHAHAQV